MLSGMSVKRSAWASEGPTVSVTSTLVSRQKATVAAYANIEFNADGTENVNALAGTDTFSLNVGTWLTSGNASDVWVERTVNSGTLDAHDPGTGRKNLGTTQQYGIVDTTLNNGADTAGVTFNFYDAASGGNLLESATVSFIANYTNA